MFFSPKSRFRRRCRKRLGQLGFTLGSTDDLTVDIVGGLRGRPHVFLVRPSGIPMAPSSIRDIQETKLRYWDRRLVCITEQALTRNWVREAGERRVFLVAFNELTALAELPVSDDDALKLHMERAGV